MFCVQMLSAPWTTPVMKGWAAGKTGRMSRCVQYRMTADGRSHDSTAASKMSTAAAAALTGQALPSKSGTDDRRLQVHALHAHFVYVTTS
jgi:hypothetical protein